MMFLRVCSISTYGKTHCEGILKSYKNYPLDKNMTLNALGEFIKEKVNLGDDSFTLEFMEDE